MTSEPPDDQLSSEDMLRRARQGLGSEPTAPSEGLAPEPATPPSEPTAEPEEPQQEGWTELAGAAAPSEPTAETEPPVVEHSPETWRTPDLLTGADETTVQHSPDDWSAQGPLETTGTTPTRKPSRGLLSTLWRFSGLAILAVVGIIALVSFLDSSKSVDRIEVGECLDEPSGETFEKVDIIDCDEPHDYEVFAKVTIVPTTVTVLPDMYPGFETVYEAAGYACLDEFETYVGTAWDDSLVWLDVFTPTEEGWEDGDRTGICVLYQGDYESIVKTTGSLRGSGL